MRPLRSAALAGPLSLLAALVLAPAASAASTTFYVNGKTGKDTNPCSEPAAPCKTIKAAIEKAEEDTTGEADAIEVASGVYEERVSLRNPAANGITINGAGSGPGGTEIEGPEKATAATVGIETIGGGESLSNLSVVNDKLEDKGVGIMVAARATLTNVVVTMEQAVNAAGIEAQEVGALTMRGGGVTMEAGTEGQAIASQLAPTTVEGASVLISAGSKAAGIEATSPEGTSITGTVVRVLSTVSEHAAMLVGLSPVTLTGDTVIDNSAKGQGLEAALPAPLTATGVNVSMTNPADKEPAVVQEFGTATYANTSIGGSWAGPGFGAESGNMTLLDSHITEGPGSPGAAVEYFAGPETPGLVVQRSVLQAEPTALGVVLAAGANVTLDSSELLGGHTGIDEEQLGGKVRQVTVSASTIDAGTLGVADGGGVTDLMLGAGGHNGELVARVNGSVLMEGQKATVGAGAKAVSITCGYSDVPSQSQAPSGTEGSIQCASGSNGNASPALGEVFATPVTAYALSPSSPAVDSVPAGAITLPFGLTPSATDLAGNPRVVDGNGDCIALQDRGALELQGHAAPCPPPPIPPAPHPSITSVPPSITALTVSPRSFSAAPSGATISAKKSYGSKIAYRDSQKATNTFTVLHEERGRKQGRSCKKPAKANAHGKRCTILTKVGTFTHADAAGANSLHFSGRIHNRKLAKGAYRVQAIAANTNGRSTTAAAGFEIH
jgi:hypothetical protein